MRLDLAKVYDYETPNDTIIYDTSTLPGSRLHDHRHYGKSRSFRRKPQNDSSFNCRHFKIRSDDEQKPYIQSINLRSNIEHYRHGQLGKRTSRKSQKHSSDHVRRLEGQCVAGLWQHHLPDAQY